MTYLLDTSWMIQLLAGHNDTVIFHKQLHPQNSAVSCISVVEMYNVAFDYANLQAHLSSFRQFLAPFTVLTLNELIMEQFAD